MKQYLDLINHTLKNGAEKGDRTGTGTLSTFGYQMRFDLEEGFPLLTTKKLHLPSIIHELLWFISGSTNIKYLQDNNVRIWNEWADEQGNLGPVYGWQWRAWPDFEKDETVDQIKNLVKQLKRDPDSRRMIVSAWNVADLEYMALAPCHLLFQCYVANGKLSLQVYQRSADIFLGVPFNIASYALLTMMLAQVCGLGLGELIWTGGDCHLYMNHLDQARTQIERETRELPKMIINPAVTNIDGFKFSDFTLEGYDPHPHIAGKVAV